MARMIPLKDSDSFSNIGERLVYEALQKQLPKDWIVRYNFPISFINGGVLLENEADFIVVAPNYGLMFIEVKSAKRYECKEGKWYRFDHENARMVEMHDHPFIQASRAKNNIISCICKRIWNKAKDDFPGVFGHIVALPRCAVDGGLPGSQTIEIIVLEKDMNNLMDKILKAFAVFGWRNNGNAFDKQKVDQVLTFLKEECILFTSTISEVEEEERVVERLTNSQTEVFENLLDVEKSALVYGGAGTGKTMLAAWLATRMARNGKKVLFLCYNRVLGASLRSQLERPNLKVTTYLQYARECITKAGKNYPTGNNDVTYCELIPNMMVDSLRSLISHEEISFYDGIFVDEAQDFRPSWWDTLMEIYECGRTKVYIFADSKQSLYGMDVYPPVQKEFELHVNCRNTKEIAHYCTNLAADGSIAHEESKLGTKPIITEVTYLLKDRAELIRKTVNEWLSQGIPASKIALLSPYTDDKYCSLNLLRPMSNIPLTSIISSNEAESLEKWQNDKAIWRSTIKAFKGMESSFVIITDVNESICQNQNEIYVACSRAKSRLVIIPVDDKAHKMCINWGNSI